MMLILYKDIDYWYELTIGYNCLINNNGELTDLNGNILN